MADGLSLNWRAYDGLVRCLSLLHYGVLSRFSQSDEGGLSWYRRRLDPVFPRAADRPRVWIHAVSAGESKVAGLLLSALRAQAPQVDVVLSATTHSGYARAVALAGADRAFILPLDTLPAQHRLFAAVQPQVMVLVESEFWPAQFAAARAANVPVVVVNATMSQRSFRRHRRFGAVAGRTILRADHIHAQDSATLERYRALGVPVGRLGICGNLKLAPPADRPPRGETVPTVTFGNVHAAELPVLAEAAKYIRAERPGLRLVFVPRYPARLDAGTARAALGNDLTVIDDIGALPGAGTLVWLRQMGTLANAYALSTIGVVCGTFAPIGGHDLAEPLHLGAAVIYGPHVERQRALHETLDMLKVASPVVDASTLAAEILRLIDDPEKRATRQQRFQHAAKAAVSGVATIADDLARRVLRPRRD